MKGIKLVTAALLVLAIFKLPYGYYEFLRIIVSISAGLSAAEAFDKGNAFLTFLFIAVLVLFNPILPIYLSKAMWMPIDIIVAILFGSTALNDETS
tara:strand:+ start:7187 stop:7474 length:288 start_codon:yes stop_codon:yes gene_type:complete